MTPSSRYIQLKSYQCKGLGTEEVLVEALRTRGLATLKITGLPDSWLKDSREKIQALSTHSVGWDALDKVLIHILPADEIKNGAHLELPIALACMMSLYKEEIPEKTLELLKRHHFIGHLSLDGRILPTQSSEEVSAQQSEGLIGPHTHSNIQNLWGDLMVNQSLPTLANRPVNLTQINSIEAPPHIRGRVFEKQSLTLAAAAGIPVLMVGLPGSGKSALANWARQLLHFFQAEQNSSNKTQLQPPFLNPHSRSGIWEFLGSQRASQAQPGIFARAHGGLLVLDEFAELNRDVREVLRTILDQKKIQSFIRGKASTYPADFWLIATMNPCPCGFAKREDLSRCRCKQNVVNQYAQRLSGPMFDRFGLKLFFDYEDEKKLNFPGVPTELSQLKDLGIALKPADNKREHELALQIETSRRALSRRSCQLKAKFVHAFERVTGANAESHWANFLNHFDQEEKIFYFRPEYRSFQNIPCSSNA